MKKLICWLAASTLLSSCAVIVSGTKARITLEGDTKDTLTVETNVQTYNRVTLPAEVKVKRNHLNDPVIVTSDSGLFEPIFPGSRMNALVLGNLLTWGLPGIIVDAASGAANSPKQDVYWVRAGSGMQYVSKIKKHYLKLYRHEIDVNVSVAATVKGEYAKMRDQLNRFMESGERMYDDFYCGIPLGATSIGLAYFYHLDKHWAVGAMYGKTTDSDEASAWFSDDGRKLEELYNLPYDERKGHKYGGDFYVRSRWLMPAVKCSWLQFDAITLYSKAAFGLQHQHVWLDGKMKEPSPIGSLDPTKVNFSLKTSKRK